MKNRTKAFLPFLVAVALSAGCGTTDVLNQRPAEVSLPTWFTAPVDSEQLGTPANLGMRLPRHLRPFAAKYALPNWVVYGVVRCLGQEELLVNGTYKTFTERHNNTESTVVVDEVYYDVTVNGIDIELARIARLCAEAKSETDRIRVLSSFVTRRFGGYVLFDLSAGSGGKGKNEESLLLASGESAGTPRETFSGGRDSKVPPVGWRETATHYISTTAGDFSYGDIIGSFRRAEEDGIQEMSRCLAFKRSQMRKDVTVHANDGDVDVSEEVAKEEFMLRMRGIRITRRFVDLENRACVIVVTLPVDGVALR
jgi:hypothetical protein